MTCACETQDIVKKVFENHTEAQKDDLIPILQDTQEALGYLPSEAMQKIAKFLGVAPGVVLGVATFYTQFKRVPSGKTKVMVCRGTACHVRGGVRIQKEVERRLGIKPGETTEDMEYSLETVACIGACALSPNITINDEVHGQMTTKKVGEIFSDRTREGT